ncbi:hypothetical protein [Kribbella kalugense]|uniref:RelA/SpoT domain-containing protein n=1 Tax=Kribbella kalugense TaxID=2512221 RepID=A0A4R7ZPR4_9ACTN|nr:hypothetical protein [Kribbella kalugense]TDW19376.1 hypothetical protein EV650_5982 [Kribbella kalugense]
MPCGPIDLPEPADLYARLTARRPLDWGDPIPTKAQISAEYGAEPTARSLHLLSKAAAVEPDITEAVISAIGVEAEAYHLENRLKSPQSLARKLVRFEEYYRRPSSVPDDILRYTAAVKHPDELTKAAVRTIDRLTNNNWQMADAHHSYVDGSRYKGVHTHLRSLGELIEVQVHSTESIDVKERTTTLYEIERDREQEPATRDAARRECIALSDQMTQPAGIDDLQELGGVKVNAISYGKKRRQRSSNAAPNRTSAESSAPQHTRQQFQDRRNGTSR